MSGYRAIQVPGGIAIEGPDEDAAYRDLVAREEPPRIEAEPPRFRCRYFKGRVCDCFGRGTCVEVA